MADLVGSIEQVDKSTVKLNLELGDEHLAAITISCNVSLRANPTALIAAFLPIAAKMHHNLRVIGTLDREAADNSVAAIDILSGWFTELSNARLVDGEVASNNRSKAEGVACLASLGLDSFYSIHTRRDEITHLILCRGFDISLDNDPLWDRTVKVARTVAKAENKKLIEVVTDIRDLSDKYLHWSSRYHGAAIAG